MIYGALPRSPHALSDFVSAGNAPPPATRKLLASLRPDIDAWSAEPPNTTLERHPI